VQRWLKLTKYLPENNITPVVLSVNADRATYPVIDPSLEDEIPPDLKVHKTTSREIYSFYKSLNRKRNVPYGGFANQGSKGFLEKINIWIRGNFFIPDPRKGWNKFAIKKALEIINTENISAIITTSPPHSTQLTGLLLKKWTGLPWIADLRDPWTDIYYYKDLMPSCFAHKKNLALEKKVVENADRIVVVSEGMKELFLQKSNRLNPECFHIIPNGFDEEDFTQEFPEKEDKFIITYTGTLTEKYGIGVLFQAIKNIVNSGKKNILFRLVGSVSPGFHRLVSENSLQKYIEFIDYVPHSQSIEYLLQSSVLFIAIPETEKNKLIMTGKIFEYLAVKKPILLLGPPEGATAQVISSCESGKAFSHNEPDKIESWLNDLHNKWSAGEKIFSGNDNYMNYSRKNLAGIYADIIEKILPG